MLCQSVGDISRVKIWLEYSSYEYIAAANASNNGSFVYTVADDTHLRLLTNLSIEAIVHGAAFNPSIATYRDLSIEYQPSSITITSPSSITGDTFLRGLAMRDDTGATVPREVSGHSARRSGAQWFARRGLPLWAIQYLGRWGSDSVRLYTAQAFAERHAEFSVRVAAVPDVSRPSSRSRRT